MPADQTTTNGDQKATNATIYGEIKLINKLLSDFIERSDKRLEKIEDCQKQDHDAITTLKTKYDIWSGLNSLGTVIAGLIGSIIK